MISYLISFLIVGGIYAVAVLSLNLQWGYTGLMNYGLGAFYIIGAYATAILTTQASPEYVGGFHLPILIGLGGGVLAAGVASALLAFPALRLRGGFFAIFMLATSETIRLIVKNEGWLTNGVWGIRGIPRPLRVHLGSTGSDLAYLGLVLVCLVGVYGLIELSIRSPWGRVLTAIRGDETLASFAGKNVWVFKYQSFVLGSMVMGLAGALYAHYTGYISPEAFPPLMATFIVWLMMMLGGTGNNRGAVVGAFIVWGIWVGSEFLIDFLPSGWATQAGFIRMFLVGLMINLILLWQPQGLLGRERIVSTLGKE